MWFKPYLRGAIHWIHAADLNVWLWSRNARFLCPKRGNGSSHLDERREQALLNFLRVRDLFAHEAQTRRDIPEMVGGQQGLIYQLGHVECIASNYTEAFCTINAVQAGRGVRL